MFYVLTRSFEIVSKHETREAAEAAKVGTQHVADADGVKAIIWGIRKK